MQDILIIGGGVIGLSLARRLHKKGVKKITIIDREEIGRESSFAAAGMLAPNAETEQKDVFYEFCAESLNLYPDFAEQLLAETGVDIELDRSGSLYLAFSETDSTEINRRYERQKSAGFPVEHLTARETLQAEPFVSPDVRESLFYPNDWQVENRRLLRALEKYADSRGIKIVRNAEIANLLIENNRVVGAETAGEKSEKFSAAAVVLATGAWTSLIKTGSFRLPPVKPIRGQIISYQTAKRLFQKVIYSPRGYIVPRADGRILVGATVEDAGFNKTITGTATEFLRDTAAEISNNLGKLEIADEWVGLRPMAADGLPVLGAFSEVENLFVATAHYRNGILLAPLTANIVAGAIVDDLDAKYLKIFSPQRFRAARAF